MDCSEGCPTAAVMFGVPGVRVLAAERDVAGLELIVETDQATEGCRRWDVLAVLHDRREHLLHDAPFGHRRVRWRKRVWRCLELACPVGKSREAHELAAPRALLTRRAITWAADALADDDTTVNALARRLGGGLAYLVKVEATGAPTTRSGCPGSSPSASMRTSGGPAGLGRAAR